MTPQYCIKYIHNSKIHAVKIVEWENHHEVATVPDCFTWHTGEPSEGLKAANLFAAAPELLDALKSTCRQLESAIKRLEYSTDHHDREATECMEVALKNARAAIERAEV